MATFQLLSSGTVYTDLETALQNATEKDMLTITIADNEVTS